MNADHYPAEFEYEEWEEAPSEPPPTQWELVRARLRRMRTAGLRVALFIAGVAATFVALLLYQAFFPPPPPLTTTDVNNSIAQAFASATPAPAFSERVYQVIQPSLILI